jgi:hypothetical protein
MGARRGGSGATGSSDDSSVLAAVSSTSGPNLYTTSSSAIVDASVLLIEVEDVGGNKRRFPANVGEGFLHVLLNETFPIY